MAVLVVAPCHACAPACASPLPLQVSPTLHTTVAEKSKIFPLTLGPTANGCQDPLRLARTLLAARTLVAVAAWALATVAGTLLAGAACTRDTLPAAAAHHCFDQPSRSVVPASLPRLVPEFLELPISGPWSAPKA